MTPIDLICWAFSLTFAALCGSLALAALGLAALFVRDVWMDRL